MFSPINFRFTRAQYLRILDWKAGEGIKHTGKALKQLLFKHSALPSFTATLPPPEQAMGLLAEYQSKTATLELSLRLLHTEKFVPQSLFDSTLLIQGVQTTFSNNWSFSEQIKGSTFNLQRCFPLEHYFHNANELYDRAIPIRIHADEKAWLDYASAFLGGASYGWTVRYLLFKDKSETIRRVTETRSQVEMLFSQSVKYKNLLLQVLSWFQLHNPEPPAALFEAFALSCFVCERLEAALSGRSPLDYAEIVKQARAEKLLPFAEGNSLPKNFFATIDTNRISALVEKDKINYANHRDDECTFTGALDILQYFQKGNQA